MSYEGALCLVVRGRHVGGIISWGRHDCKLTGPMGNKECFPLTLISSQ